MVLTLKQDCNFTVCAHLPRDEIILSHLWMSNRTVRDTNSEEVLL